MISLTMYTVTKVGIEINLIEMNPGPELGRTC